MIRKSLRRLPFIFLIVLAALGVSAQDGRALSPDVPVTDVLDGEQFVQVYPFLAVTDQPVSISVSNELGIPLAVAVTDGTGTSVVQATGDVSGVVSVETGALVAGGTYYVTIFKAAGVGSAAAVEFTVTLTSVDAATTPEATIEITPPATAEPLTTEEATANPAVTADVGQVITTTGMTVNLTWSTPDDLDLEVRDPVGGSLYFETPTVASGGTLGPNVNQGCAIASPTPVETGTWSPGGIPTGSYELLVYFQQACDNQDPVSFTLDVTVDGTSLSPISGTVLPGEVFVTSFFVDGAGNATASGLSGIVDDQILPDTAANILASATPVTIGSAINGTITGANPYDAYSFNVAANDLVTISLNASSGSLDTFLLLLDSQGNIVRSNDDIGTGITDSQISNALLTTPGVYTIVATRYGKRVGGTEGDYSLVVGAAATNLPEEFLALERGTLEFTLIWNTDDDLQLLVRDPAGDAVYDDTPSIRSGGQLGAQGNVNCVPATTGTPFSYVFWPQSIAPRPGVYEIEVWYQSECGTPQPVNFNLFATYNGQEIFNVSAQPILNERYLISFTLNPDGTTTLSDGGIIRGLSTLPYQAELENAGVITSGQPINGSITQDNKFDLYVFEAEAGDLVNIAMNATSGTLDPTLYLVGPFGNSIAENDDTVPGENRNSLISNLTLPESGQYIIIATHFGALYGGTTGTYSLTLTQLN